MKIALASDHAGYTVKKGIVDYLEEMNIPFFDFGCKQNEKADYPDMAVKAIQGFLAGDCDRIILICGTGIGMTLAANRFRGVRATLCCNQYMAEMSRKHNDSNCLTLGGRVLSTEKAIGIVRIWLETEFEGGRHQKRLDKITLIEENQCIQGRKE